jgi:hypothetical protein
MSTYWKNQILEVLWKLSTGYWNYEQAWAELEIILQ